MHGLMHRMRSQQDIKYLTMWHRRGGGGGLYCYGAKHHLNAQQTSSTANTHHT